MIVGKTGPGKSVVWKTLQSTLSTLKKNGEAGFNAVKVIAFKYFFNTMWPM